MLLQRLGLTQIARFGRLCLGELAATGSLELFDNGTLQLADGELGGLYGQHGRRLDGRELLLLADLGGQIAICYPNVSCSKARRFVPLSVQFSPRGNQPLGGVHPLTKGRKKSIGVCILIDDAMCKAKNRRSNAI